MFGTALQPVWLSSGIALTAYDLLTLLFMYVERCCKVYGKVLFFRVLKKESQLPRKLSEV